MTNKELKIFIDEFINNQDDSSKDEWWVTDKQYHEGTMHEFILFLKSKGVKIN